MSLSFVLDCGNNIMSLELSQCICYFVLGGGNYFRRHFDGL